MGVYGSGCGVFIPLLECAKLNPGPGQARVAASDNGWDNKGEAVVSKAAPGGCVEQGLRAKQIGSYPC